MERKRHPGKKPPLGEAVPHFADARCGLRATSV